MMMSKYIVNVNDGVWGSGEVFDFDGLVELFKGLGVEKFEDDEGEVYELVDGINELIGYGDVGGMMKVVNEELCERGDDYCELSVCELDEEEV